VLYILTEKPLYSAALHSGKMTSSQGQRQRKMKKIETYGYNFRSLTYEMQHNFFFAEVWYTPTIITKTQGFLVDSERVCRCEQMQREEFKIQDN